MTSITNYPFLVFLLAFGGMTAAAYAGAWVARKRHASGLHDREDFNVILGATLTLLGLIIGFTFSMAIGRYDQRKNYEEEEANAIGTEFLRAELLPPSDAASTRALLLLYLDQRIVYYTTRDAEEQRQIEARTTQLQSQLWSAVKGPALAQPSPITALAVSGMNDVLNTQGYTQAAWWNRIPVSAWMLMAAIGICANALVGFGSRNTSAKSALFVVLPLVVAISYFLIADVDSPRRGVIRVVPQNLLNLYQTLHPQ